MMGRGGFAYQRAIEHNKVEREGLMAQRVEVISAVGDLLEEAGHTNGAKDRAVIREEIGSLMSIVGMLGEEINRLAGSGAR